MNHIAIILLFFLCSCRTVPQLVLEGSFGHGAMFAVDNNGCVTEAWKK